MFVVDTNMLVYAAAEDVSEHAACARLLEQWRRRSGAWYTTWGILYEFLRVVTHPRVLRMPWELDEAWEFVDILLRSPGLHVLAETNRHALVSRELVAAVPGLGGNGVHDAHIVALMLEHGIGVIYSRDRGFDRFPAIERRDPLA